jgi:hypothetical protein
MHGRLAMFASLACVAGALAQPPPTIHRAEYAQRLRSMWLAQCIANWTGLRTEGRRNNPPFSTDADWGQVRDGILIDFVLTQDPWLADDDTDIEYVYLHGLAADPSPLTPARVRELWIPHINRFIWVSNARARELMGPGVVPPMTGSYPASTQGLMIDAQLTTEFFGLFAPGMPERAIIEADAAVRATAIGHAAHAAQFNIALYSLAASAPSSLPLADRLRWMYDRARATIPSSSKAADIADFVLADFLANPDPNDWERTRDAVYQRYQADAAANGFRYRAWYESSVNFAGMCAGLLYGRGDLRRTIQICTLWGWDSDNATATLGGLLGFMLGPQGVAAAFPGVTFSDRFNITRTRDALPDYLPADPAAEDTFTAMAARMLPIADAVIARSGGLVAPDRWLPAPPVPAALSASFNPTSGVRSDDARSANLRVRRAGGLVSPSSSANGSPPGGQGATANPGAFADATEHNGAGIETPDSQTPFFSTQGSSPPGGLVTLTVTYDRPVTVRTIRFIEGDHFTAANQSGGWFTSLEAQVRVNGFWITPAIVSQTPLDPNVPFQIIDMQLAQDVTISGLRVQGIAGGAHVFITASELDAFAVPPPQAFPTYDLNADNRIDDEDVIFWHRTPADLDADGDANRDDADALERAARWRELERLWINW